MRRFKCLIGRHSKYLDCMGYMCRVRCHYCTWSHR